MTTLRTTMRWFSLVWVLFLSFFSGWVSSEVIQVSYGYFPEARPIHAACALGWLDLHLDNNNIDYKVTCYPQTSGNFATARLDNGQLDIANLGSTPLAQAVARKLDISVVYLSHYMGESQGIYARGDGAIETPFDLEGHVIGVPFGSTMHLQLLFVLELFGLQGRVNVKNLSPTEIKEQWDQGEIDAAACWGNARDYILQNIPGIGNPNLPPAKPLLTAGTVADWGRPTFVAIAANKDFLSAHPEFVKHFVAVLSRINDSFVDNLGQIDSDNAARWTTMSSSSITSYVPSMVDALMNKDEQPGNPSQAYQNAQRRALDLFVHLTAEEQLDCSYLGPPSSNDEDNDDPCVNLLLQDIEQTIDFLSNQKVIGNCPNDAHTPCESNYLESLDGTFLKDAQENCGPRCYPVGPYPGQFTSSLDLLSALEGADLVAGKDPFPLYERGRSYSISTCAGYSSLLASSLRESLDMFRDASYTDNLDCSWGIQTVSSEYRLRIDFDRVKLWSGDFVNVYTNPNGDDCSPGNSRLELVAHISGFYEMGELPSLEASGCLRVDFHTDGNLERYYGGDGTSLGDGFRLSFFQYMQIDPPNCDGFHWGADCTFTDFCVGTKHMMLSSEPEPFASSGSDEPKPYPNDLDCIFEFEVPYWADTVELEIRYDLEYTHDLIWLQTGSSTFPNPFASRDVTTYTVLTGSSGPTSSYSVPRNSETYYIPVDSVYKRARLHFTTDSIGRRAGFEAVAKAASFQKGGSTTCYEGSCGTFNEVPHCIANSTIEQGRLEASSGLASDYILGRVVSQADGYVVRPMPWAPSGGCVWPLTRDHDVPNVVGVRLLFNKPLDLEPHPKASIGDSLTIQDGANSIISQFFVEQCEENEECSAEWQTGICENKHCVVRDAVEVELLDAQYISAVLITDRNDGNAGYFGLDFEALLVEECPFEDGRHCEADGGRCENGFCICKDNIPCSCTCKGDPPIIDKVNTLLVVGIVVPLFLIFFGFFICYRRRKIKKSRAQKEVIQEKEAELDAFRNSVVGMRTATKEYIPNLGGAPVAPKVGKRAVLLPPPKVQWCWQETSHMMSQHSADSIVGDPEDCWIKYTKDSNDAIEAAFNRQKQLGQFSPLPGYVVDFEWMTQTKSATGFQRGVRRVVQSSGTKTSPEQSKDFDLNDAHIEDSLPEEIRGEPQMVLVSKDIVQISQQRNDGWAFGTKLFHNDEALSRQLLSVATKGIIEDEANVFTDTGWFPLEATQVPSGEDLAVLQANVGDTGALDAPTSWDPVADPTVVQLQDLNRSGEEYQAVVTAFKRTLKPPKFNRKVTVVKVQRIQNLAMWQSYVVKRQTICYRETGHKSSRDANASEADIQRRALKRFERFWLWHGTNIEVMDKIMQQGFNRSFCGKNATVYGKGVYFARDASYSAYPTYAVPDMHGYQYIMACRVVVGEYCPGTTNALTPDIRDPTTQSLYDSTVGLLKGDTMANPSIYVTYHDAQAYPEYLIKFKTKG